MQLNDFGAIVTYFLELVLGHNSLYATHNDSQERLMTAKILFEMLSSSIGQLTLSQPKRRNAINAKMWNDLPEVLNNASKNKGLKALIVTGDGAHFSSGADISEFETLYSTPESAEKTSLGISNGLESLATFPLPTIAMIRGTCVGGGCALALSCDIRFADATSKFAITPAKLGLVYPFSDVQRLIETVGIPHAKDMLFSARPIQAKVARKMGLINQIFKVDNLEAKTLAYANNMSALSTQSLAVTKQMFAAYQSGLFTNSEQTTDWFQSRFSSQDFKTGYKAFLEKRKPDFS